MKPLAVIPARGGSKRLPGKNIKPLAGKPLIHYTINAAREIFDDNCICVSTDDPKIRKTTEETGLKVSFLRPRELATDNATSRDVLLHAIEFNRTEKDYDADTVILLQPTSPFRTGTHIKEALKLYNPGLDMVVSVKKTKSNPYSLLYEENETGFLKKSKDPKQLISLDNIPPVWELNGAIYIINSRSLHEKPIPQFDKIRKYVMSERSSIDIDTEIDWKLAQIFSNS